MAKELFEQQKKEEQLKQTLQVPPVQTMVHKQEIPAIIQKAAAKIEPKLAEKQKPQVIAENPKAAPKTSNPVQHLESKQISMAVTKSQQDEAVKEIQQEKEKILKERELQRKKQAEQQELERLQQAKRLEMEKQHMLQEQAMAQKKAEEIQARLKAEQVEANRRAEQLEAKKRAEQLEAKKRAAEALRHEREMAKK